MAFDDVILGILSGGAYNAGKKVAARKQANEDIELSQRYGAPIEELRRGQALQAKGVSLPPPDTMTPGPSQAAAQFAGAPPSMPLVNQPMMGPGTSLPMNPPPMPAQDMRALGTWGEFMQMNKGLQRQGMEKGQVSIAETQAQTNLKNQQAGWYGAKAALPGGGVSGAITPVQQAAAQYGIETGLLAPQELTFRGPKTQIMLDGISSRPDFKQWYAQYQQGGNVSPNPEAFNPFKSDVNFQATKAGQSAAERYQTAGPAQTLGRYATSTRNVIQMFSQASESYDRMPVEFLNTPYNELAKQTSGPALRFKNQVNDLRAHLATMYSKGYAPQDLDRKQAIDAVPDTITPSQVRYMIPFWNQIVDSQVEGMMTPVGPKDVQSANKRLQGSGIGRSQTLEPGTIKKGYKFKGGNPGDKNNWVKQ